MKQKLQNIVIGILCTIFFLCLGIFTAIQFRPLYYFDIDYLNIVEQSGYSKEIILENYNTLIDYCSPFYRGNLTFPSLTITDAATLHFQRVKVIFDSSFYIGIISLFLLLILLYQKYQKRDFKCYKTISITMIILPIFTALGCAINWDGLFVAFHQIFFRGDYWLFDWNKDQIIRILPDTFFLHCALIIIAVILLGSGFFFLLWKWKHKKNNCQV